MDNWIALANVGVAIAGVVIALISAALGGCIAGWFTLRGVDRQARINKEMQLNSEKALVSATLQAICAEIEIVFLRYQGSMGVKIEALEEGEMLDCYYPVSSDYFSVYLGNAAQIGKLSSKSLQRSIVTIYVMFRGLRDSYELNNRCLDEYVKSLRLAEETGSSKQQEQSRLLEQRLVEYAGELKVFHGEVRKNVEAIRAEFAQVGLQ